MNKQEIYYQLYASLQGQNYVMPAENIQKEKDILYMIFLVHSMQNQVCYLFIYFEGPIGIVLFKLKKITNFEFINI